MAVEYPPYVNGYGGIPKLFAAIREAGVPPKFTQDFLGDVLNLKSSSYRAMIPLMKNLGFIDPGNVPTQAYRDVGDAEKEGGMLAVRKREPFKTRVYLNKQDLEAYKTAPTAKGRGTPLARENYAKNDDGGRTV